MSLNYPSSKNPFGDDDDFGFDSNKGGNSRGTFGGSGWDDDVDDDDFASRPMTKEEKLQKLKEKSMNRQLDSTKRAMASIYDSEATGIATAEDLLAQGEQLDNVEKKTHTINQDLKVSQRHLNGIKSIFGGIKNWWSGNKDDEDSKQRDIPQRDSRLRNAVDSSNTKSGPHPAYRLKKEDLQGFYEDEVDSTASGSAGGSGYGSGSTWPKTEEGGFGAPRKAEKVKSRNEYDARMDDNLGVMSDGMSRLKDLALGLGDEITTQNEQIDRIMGQADRADQKLRDQNREMRGVLGQKGAK